MLLVLVTVYFSSQAQFRGLEDQALTEQLSRLESQTRLANQTMEATVHVLSTELQNMSATRRIERDSIAWDLAATIVIIDRNRHEARRGYNPAGLTTPEILAEPVRQWAAGLRKIDVRLENNSQSPRLFIASPTRAPNEIAVAVIDPARLAALLPQPQREVPWGIAVVADDQGTILAAINNLNIAKPVREIASKAMHPALDRALAVRTSFGQIIPEGDDATLFSSTCVEISPDQNWHMIVTIPDGAAAVRAKVQPLIEQLAWWAMLILVAVALVLASTTISLVRQRRRIEQLRTDILNRDLTKARRIQLNWLPKPLSHTQRIDIAAENVPALHISGDFYNWFELPPPESETLPRTAVILGDVSGHGLPAAFLMSTTQMLVKSTLSRVHDPGQCLSEINEQLCSFVYGGQFVTLTILVIDHEKNTLAIASAGQTQPLIRCEARFEMLDIDTDLVLGVNRDIAYRTYTFDLDPHATLVLYTDGITETVNEKDEPFGLTRLIQCLNKTDGEIEDRIRQLYKTLTTFRGEADPADDQTLVGLQLHPAEVPKDSATSALL